MVECPKCHSENNDGSRFCSSCAAPLGQAGSPTVSLTRTLETPVHVVKPGNLIAGKYKIIDEIGHGGMGVVYKAEDIKLKRSVALKFLPPHLMDSPEIKERFLVEAQAAAALSHPNICVIHEVGESEERPYIAMEYVEGQTLRDKIRKGALKPEEVLDIVTQVAAGLGAAHGKGIIHRDIKSANIIVTGNGQAKVMDFGLAKLRGGTSLTKSQTTLGTVSYMSPEQARGDALDGRTDIWSLGVVLYEMLAGRLPFRGDHDQAVIHSILHEEPKPLHEARPDTASGLEQIIGQALAKDAVDRYQTMEEFLEDLKAIAEGLKPLRAKPRLAKGRIFGLRKIYVYAGLAVMAVLLSLNVGGVRDRLTGRIGAPVRSIKLAVLPFVNLTADPEQEYFSDGMTQEMIAQLARLHPQSLSVIARTSVMRYKKSETPVDQIGRDLGVDYVLEGSARREASRIRITAELVQVRDQTQLWAETYDREVAGILALQSDVAQKVAAALAFKLLPAERARLANARPVNPEAYDAYLKGSHHWIMLTKEDLDIAERYFELALAKDPSYSAAYAGVALVWVGRQQTGIAPPSEAGPKAKAAALKAVAFDDAVAEAHFALAQIMTMTDWDWAGAEREWKRTVELNPSYPEALATYSHFLNIMGRPEEAMTQIKRALELDPFNVIIQGFYAVDLLFARRYDEAIVQARNVLRAAPGHPLAVSALWVGIRHKGMAKEKLAAAKDYFALYDDADVNKALEKGYQEGDYAGAMSRAAKALAASSRKIYVGPTDMAELSLEAGDKDRALEWLKKGFETRDPFMPYLGLPQFDRLRSEPRFQALLRRMGIPEGGKK